MNMNHIPQSIHARHADAVAAFAVRLNDAMAELKDRLQEQYERAYPGHAELVRDAIDHAEAFASDLSMFPHLFLPDLVEARMAELRLRPAFARSEASFAHAA